MDCVFVEDVARANILALQADRRDEVYNVASGHETSLVELWGAIQAAAGAEHLSAQLHPPRKVNSVPRRLADTRRAWEELGFRAEVSLSEGLKRLADWRRAELACLERVA
jgi:UDP-glucose 4-epimerase